MGSRRELLDEDLAVGLDPVPNLGGKPPYVDSHRTTLNLGRDLADASAKSDASNLGRRVLSGCRPRSAHVDSAHRLLSTSSARHSLYNASRVFLR